MFICTWRIPHALPPPWFVPFTRTTPHTALFTHPCRLYFPFPVLTDHTHTPVTTHTHLCLSPTPCADLPHTTWFATAFPLPALWVPTTSPRPSPHPHTTVVAGLPSFYTFPTQLLVDTTLPSTHHSHTFCLLLLNYLFTHTTTHCNNTTLYCHYTRLVLFMGFAQCHTHILLYTHTPITRHLHITSILHALFSSLCPFHTPTATHANHTFFFLPHSTTASHTFG